MSPLLILLQLLVLVSSKDSPRIKISDGEIDGTILETKEGRNIFAFLGIPFAEPPLGSLRFMPPIPKKPWKNVLDATKSHNICPQKDMFSQDRVAKGSEDCLFLNVYTPSLFSENSELLPVMVFFHGGGFIFGSGDYAYYGPELLLDHDIVLVIGNYRLGALGFLSTGDEVSPGNYGLKDQSLILKWVNKNIEKFGGDPKHVTLFGESAGGASSHFHMFSPLSRGLFKGVISQSGSVFNFWALAPEGENPKNAKTLAESVDCPTSSSKILVECLRNVDPLILVDQDEQFMKWNEEPIIPFKPVVEPHSVEAFLTDTPYNLLRAGKFEDVPWIVGLTEREGLLKSIGFIDNLTLIDDLNKDFNKIAAITLHYEAKVKDIDVIGKQVREFYFGDSIIDIEESFSGLTDMYSDAWFISGVDEAIRNVRRVAKKPVFTYIFDHNGPISVTFSLSSSERFHGSCHGDDLIYQFPNFQGFDPNTNKLSIYDKKFTQFFTTLWVNFARTGNPTPEKNDIIKTKWKPVKSDKLEYYYITPNIHEMRRGPFEERIHFWRNLPFETKYYQKDEL